MNTNNTASTPAYLRNEINITVGCEWGIQNTVEDGVAHAVFAQHWMQQAYPEAAVNVSFDSSVGRDQISNYCNDVSDSDVLESLDKCWDAFSDAGRPR